jgi:hypothetical protein
LVLLVTKGRIVNRPFGPGPGPKRVAMRPRCDRDAAYTDSPGPLLKRSFSYEVITKPKVLFGLRSSFTTSKTVTCK